MRSPSFSSLCPHGVLVTDPPNQPSPMAAAMEWVSRIFAVALEMLLPGLAGIWLDKKLGTGFLVLVGFGLGIALAIWHLLAMSKRATNSRKIPQRNGTKADKPRPDD